MCNVLLFAKVSYALTTDKQQPMHITTNFAHWDGNTNTTTLVGKVVIIQGTTTVTADKLVLFSDKQNQIKQAIATGNLASYTTTTDISKPQLHAVAQTIQYFPPTGEIILIGQAHVQQGYNTVSAPKLVYNMNAQTVVSPATPNGRTTIVIQPQQISKIKSTSSSNTSTAKPVY
jgi:lipopolysaccharide export system protein LptA